eukprot:scaffold10096_cov29-Attheya_sp.AAC.4
MHGILTTSTTLSEPPFLWPLSLLAEITHGVSTITLAQYTAVHTTSSDCGSPPQPFHAPKPLQVTLHECLCDALDTLTLVVTGGELVALDQSFSGFSAFLIAL